MPHTLTGLVGRVLNGSNIRDQPNHLCIPAPTLAISQLLVFNFSARRRESTTDPIKHSHHQETPVPVYLGLLMHTKTRKRDLVDILFHLGLYISYDRVLSISTDLGNKISHHFQKEDAVCPPQLKSGLFTTWAVNNIDHNPSSTSAQVFLPYVTSQLQHASRVDVVFDEYLPDSLKAATRTKRGKCIRRRVEPSSSIPRNWQAFLRIDENKVELFSFLAMKMAAKETEKQIVSAHRTDVFCTQPRDVAGLASCTHEEADTRMLLHVEDDVKQGYTKVSVRTVDTDVVVLAVTAAQRLNIDELWVAFATGRSFRFLAAHEIAKTLGPNKCRLYLSSTPSLGVIQCHALEVGVRKLHGKHGNQMTESQQAAFGALSATPNSTTIDECIAPLQRFVVLLYDRTSSQEHVNDARKQLFTQNCRTIDALPPTRAALIQHAKRAAYQAGYCWGQMMIPAPELPSPSEWWWVQRDGGCWDIYWTTLPEATVDCRQLLRCSCKKGCRGQCKCLKAALPCTALCYCGGLCAHD